VTITENLHVKVAVLQDRPEHDRRKHDRIAGSSTEEGKVARPEGSGVHSIDTPAEAA